MIAPGRLRAGEATPTWRPPTPNQSPDPTQRKEDPAWTRDEAKRGGVTGWIRNNRDGSVEAHLEGDLAAVRWLIDKMAYGPSGARVDNVEVTDAEPEGLNRFEVQH